MYEIFADHIWIGGAYELQDPTVLSDREIETVVVVAAEELTPSLPRQINCLRIPLLDGGGNDDSRLVLATKIVGWLVESGVRFVVVCSAGLSRSPCVVAAGLAIHRSTTVVTQIHRIAARKTVAVHPHLLNDLEGVVLRLSSDSV